MILALRTSKPEAELYLLNKDGEVMAQEQWQAHRQLASSLHKKLKDLLSSSDTQFTDLSGVIVYKGPGSFTGLRIGITVANTLADSYKIAVVGETGEQWISHGVQALKKSPSNFVVPLYGSDAHITRPRK